MSNHPNRGRIRDWPAHLKAFRARHDLTQDRLAELLPTATRNVERWEQDDGKPPAFLKRALRDLRRALETPTATPNEKDPTV